MLGRAFLINVGDASASDVHLFSEMRGKGHRICGLNAGHCCKQTKTKHLEGYIKPGVTLTNGVVI